MVNVPTAGVDYHDRLEVENVQLRFTRTRELCRGVLYHGEDLI